MFVATPVRPPESDLTFPGEAFPDSADSLDFSQSVRPSESMAPMPTGGIARALREAAEKSGIDPVAELFNEALGYAQEGHLRLARERLQVLLCMAPDDGEARLMLARVHVAGQRWTDALAALDEARNCGVSVPKPLRRAVEDRLRAHRAGEEEQRAAVSARNQGEVMALRHESRRFRSENAELTSRVAQLEREVRKWAWATLGVSVIAISFVLGSLYFSGLPGSTPEGAQAAAGPSPIGARVTVAPQPVVRAADAGSGGRGGSSGGHGFRSPPGRSPRLRFEEEDEPLLYIPADVEADAVQDVEEPQPMEAEPVPPTLPTEEAEPEVVDVQAPPVPVVEGTLPGGEAALDAAMATLAASPTMEGATVQLSVGSGGELVVSGLVRTFRQRKELERLLANVEGIHAIDVSAVKAESREKGTVLVVARGDTLSHIAYAYYGNGRLTKPIERANQIKPTQIRPGMKLTVPPVPVDQ